MVRRDAGEGDAPVEASTPKRCTCAEPFGPVVRIGSLVSSGDDMALRLSPDELTAYFASTREGDAGDPFHDMQIFTAVRDTLDGGFHDVMRIPELASNHQTSYPTVTSDGLTIYFESTRTYNTDYAWVATRDRIDQPFGKIAIATMGGSQPYVVGSSVWIMSNSDIAHVPYDANGLGVVELQTEINTLATEWAPVVTPDERTIYWASSRTDGNPRGALDIWCAERSDTKSTFTNLTNMRSITSSADDLPSFISIDGCRLYFTSNRSGTMGYDLFVTEK